MLLEDVEWSRNLEICIYSYRSETWHVGQHPPVKFQSSMAFETHNIMISSLTRGKQTVIINTSSNVTYPTLDTQFEIKNEKAIFDSVSDQIFEIYFN